MNADFNDIKKQRFIEGYHQAESLGRGDEFLKAHGIDIEKAKYLKRLGSPGNYTYIYDEPKGGSGKKEPSKSPIEYGDLVSYEGKDAKIIGTDVEGDKDGFMIRILDSKKEVTVNRSSLKKLDKEAAKKYKESEDFNRYLSAGGRVWD